MFGDDAESFLSILAVAALYILATFII